MFYEPLKRDHGLRHDPFKALVAPRPIGWVSTVSPDGVLNLAPYSFFNAVSERPPYLMFSSAGRKDSLTNAEATGEFVCSLATWDLREEMNTSSAGVAPAIDEFVLAGLETAPSRLVAPPRVAASPVAFECRTWKLIELPGPGGSKGEYVMVIGEVVGIHIDERFIKAGLVDTAAMRPIARLGYMEYAVVEEAFKMERPG